MQQYTPYTPETYPYRNDPLEDLRRARIETVQNALPVMADAMRYAGNYAKYSEQHTPHTTFSSTAPRIVEQPMVTVSEINVSDKTDLINGNSEVSTTDYLERLARDLADDASNMLFFDQETN